MAASTLKAVHGLVQGQPPELSLDKERALIALLTRAAAAGMLQSAHDCSDGGVAVTLAECAFDTGGIGFKVDLPASKNVVSTLFGESASRAVVSVRGREPAATAAVGGRTRRAGAFDRAYGRRARW